MRSELQPGLPFTSHEFLTPLTGLRSILELLAEGVLVDDEVAEFLALALDAVGRLERLADRLERAEEPG